jgi:general secretion pathway protein C
VRLQNLSLAGIDPRRALWIAAEVALVALLAVQTARLGWILASPTPTLIPARSTAPDDSLAILSRFDPFFRAAPESLTIATSSAFRLHGVRAGGGGSGSAIIGTPDGAQAPFSVGDEVAPGVRLVSVAPDHVVLSRGGVRTTLQFPAAEGGVPQSMVQP